jgi:hypothetical protein
LVDRLTSRFIVIFKFIVFEGIMNKQLWMTAVAVGALTVSGCGGDDSAPPPTSSAPSPLPTPSPTPESFFREIPNAISVPFIFPNKIQTDIATAAEDINGDGLKDLVIHLWTNAYEIQGETGNLPSPNKVFIYIQNKDGTFTDKTNDILNSSDFNLGGASRKVKVDDVNKDGRPDFFYAINQEDGRQFNDIEDANAQMAGLVSTGSTYKIVKFGKPSWYHSIGFGTDLQGNTFVTGNGYTRPGEDVFAFQFDASGNHRISEFLIPPVSPTSFEFFKFGATSLASDFLIQPKDDGNDYLSLRAYVLGPLRQWSSLEPISLAEKVGEVFAIGYDGSDQGLQPAFRIKQDVLTFAGISETCKIRVLPNEQQVLIAKISGAVIPNFREKMTVRQTELQPVSFLRGVSYDNGSLKQIDLGIIGEITENLNSNFFDCSDVNGDGRDDIVVYPYNQDGLPIVYLNSGDGNFKFIGYKNFPNINTGWNDGVSSIYTDFDNDGIADLLIFPANGIRGTGSVVYRFFKGTRQIQ